MVLHKRIQFSTDRLDVTALTCTVIPVLDCQDEYYTDSNYCSYSWTGHEIQTNDQLQVTLQTLSASLEKIITGGKDQIHLGITYIVWGRKKCPKGETLYSGVIGGNYVRHSAGGGNQVCLPDIPSYGQYTLGAQHVGQMYGVRYHTSSYSHLSYAHGKIVKCAACYNDKFSTSIMIPARVSCPNDWTQEYYGYLMTQPDIGGYYR